MEEIKAELSLCFERLNSNKGETDEDEVLEEHAILAGNLREHVVIAVRSVIKAFNARRTNNNGEKKETRLDQIIGFIVVRLGM